MVEATPTAPFALQFTPQLPELLAELRVSLVLSTYQAGKVIVVSSDGERLVQLPRTFDTPMGLALEGERLAIATRDTIVLLTNDPRLAPSYPKQRDTYDALFVPRSVHFCGKLQVHDLAFVDERLVGVNTAFSCLFELDPALSFRPCWQPAFISELLPQDRCHLNGLALRDGKPAYLTALGRSDEPGGWRASKQRGGVLIEAESGEVVLGDLPMPHTPRIHDGRLFVLLSASHEVAVVDVERGSRDVVTRLGGFIRGMAFAGDHVFVASSRFRKNNPFADVPSGTAPEAFCGVTAIHVPTGARVGELRYLRSCEEVYDLQVMHETRRPGLLGTTDPVHRMALSTTEGAYWAREGPPDGDSGGRDP